MKQAMVMGGRMRWQNRHRSGFFARDGSASIEPWRADPNTPALVGEPGGAEILTALLADRALTATELAAVAGVTKQTVSGHLAKLVEAGLGSVDSQGRHRYFRLA